MEPHDVQSVAGITASFLCALLEDRAAGRVKPLEDYQRRYPGFEELIAREHAAFLADEIAEDAEPPRSIGPYRLLATLGRGGQGEVWLAEDSRLKRRVAIKLLHAWVAASADAFARFRREAEIASRLDHPGICTIYETGVDQGVPFIAMRFVEGESLSQRIARERERRAKTESDGSGSKALGVFSRAELLRTLELFEKAARAVHAAHEAGVVHRDLKPANIVVTDGGEPVLLDFGLARELESEGASLTKTGELFGTPDYMAPEQIDPARGAVDRRADVYALGVTLFECLTLRRPFGSTTRDGLYRAILHAAPPNLRRLNPAAPVDLRVVLETALEKDPARRYRSALELADDLGRVRRSEPIRARRAGPLRKLARWSRREPLVASLLTILLLGAGIAGYVLARWNDYRVELDLKLAGAQKAGDVLDLERELEEAFLELGEESPELSIEGFERILARSPEHPEAVAGLVLTWAWQKDPLRAHAVLAQHRPLLEARPELRWSEVELLRIEGKVAEATALESQLEPLRGALPLFLRGYQEIQRGHQGDRDAYARARDLLQRCVEVSTTARPLFHMQHAHAVAHVSDLEARRRKAEDLLALWPELGMSWYWAAFLVAEDDPKEAVRCYERSVAMRTGDRRAWTNLGNARRANGDPEGAAAAHREALRLSPDYGHAWFNLGNLARQAKDWDEAERCYRAALKGDPRFRGAYYALSRVAFDRNDLESSEQHLRSEIKLHPDHAEAWANLGNLQRRRKAFDLAEAIFEEALKRKYPSPETWLFYGLLHRDRGDSARAMASFRTCTERAPRYAPGFRQLGNALREAKRYEEALPLLQRSVELDPEDQWGWYYLGNTQQNLGRDADALRSLRHVLAVQPKHALALHALARSLRALLRYEEARLALDAALVERPQNQEWQAARGLSLLELGRLEPAVTDLKYAEVRARSEKDERFPWAQWLAEGKARLAAAEDLYLAAIAGAELPKNPRELLDMAELAMARERAPLARRCFEELLATAAPIPYEAPLGLRARAARAAAQCGELEQARAWLAADVDALIALAGPERCFELELLARSWRDDPCFAKLRETDAAQTLWARLAATAH